MTSPINFIDPAGHNRTRTMERDGGSSGKNGYNPRTAKREGKETIEERVDDFLYPIVWAVNEDIANYDKNNTDEDVVLNSNIFSSYKGATVIRFSSNTDEFTSCAIFGIIFWNGDELAGDKQSIDTLNHEYGHLVQEALLGEYEYIKKITIPSLINRNPAGINYYSQLWERGADVYGGVTDREYSNGNDYKYSTTEQDAIDYMFPPMNRNGSSDW